MGDKNKRPRSVISKTLATGPHKLAISPQQNKPAKTKDWWNHILANQQVVTKAVEEAQ